MEAIDFYQEFLAEIPEKWEAVLEREQLIRKQHMIDVEETGKRAIENAQLANHLPVRSLISDVMKQLIFVLESRFKSQDIRARRFKKYYERLKGENYKGYIYIALTIALNAACRNDTVSRVMTNIGTQCVDEAKYSFWHKNLPKFYDYAVDLAKESTHDAAWYKTGIAKAFKNYIKGEYTKDMNDEKIKHPELEFTPWDKEYREFIKKTMFNLLRDYSGLFEFDDAHYNAFRNKNEMSYRIKPSASLLEWLKSADAALGLLGGFYLPLPIPPRPWTNTQNGGFWTHYAGQLKLIKNRNTAYQDEILNLTDQFTIIFNAVNAAQNTAWRINQHVFEVLKELARQGEKIAGLPACDDMPLPHCPKCGQPIFAHEEHDCLKDADILKAWKVAAKDIYKMNIKMRGQRLRLALALETVQLLTEDKEFYYVYQTDFRGRLYALGAITPQGSDWEKGILEFANGLPLGASGARWLAIHLANCYGNDKVSYDERVAWTKDNTEWIIRCAREPLIYREWTEADSPFMFLQAAMEWEQYQTQGDKFVSYIPIGLDGSCSGIQHYSALLRDKDGAAATNVITTPGQKRKSDIYGLVADEAVKQFQSDYVGTDAEKAKHASFALANQLMNRKICKRAVMTLPYGSTYNACRKYVDEALSERTELQKITDKKVKEQFITYVSTVVWQSIPKVVLGARIGMDYLKTVARLVAKSMCPVMWQTPTGFIVHQSYYLPNVEYIQTQLNGKTRVRITQISDSKLIDKERQVSGIAPNFVHSLDASHLMLSVDKAVKEGIQSFALVHDSLGTHACHTQQFFEILRERFHYLYSEFAPLESFIQHMKPYISEKDQENIPDIPYFNTLNVDDILKSEYLFS